MMSWTTALRSAGAALLAGLFLTSVPASADPGFDADVLVQAGHEGRPDCGPSPKGEPAALCNNTGTPGKIGMTPVVADEVTRDLRAAGITVIRAKANLEGKTYRVRDAVFIHFDGSERPCSTGASLGYPATAKSRQAAREWRGLYARRFPFGFQRDNFTPNLSGYYGFRHVNVTDAALVIEGAELTCPEQRAWLQPRLRWEGDLIAYFLSKRLGRGNLPKPPM